MKTSTTARKSPVQKKPIAKKVTTRTKPTAKKTTASKKPVTRRPDPNLPPSAVMINNLTNDILFLISQLDDYTANLRALDRRRHNGVGLKREGFIEAALRIAQNFPQYYPHWLSTQKFQNDLALFNAVKSLVEVCRTLEEKAWNINIESSDMVYTDALEYYSQVQDAAKRRVDPAESLYAELHGFFKGMGQRETEDQPTKKKAKRDANAIIEGKKDGKMVLENISPKKTGGSHEVIDETLKANASFKTTEEGNITE